MYGVFYLTFSDHSWRGCCSDAPPTCSWAKADLETRCSLCTLRTASSGTKGGEVVYHPRSVVHGAAVGLQTGGCLHLASCLPATLTLTHSHIHTHKLSHSHINTHSHNSHTHAVHTHSYTHTYTHSHIHTHTRTHSHSHTHTYTHTNSHTHT
jgi:hypothetical protein